MSKLEVYSFEDDLAERLKDPLFKKAFDEAEPYYQFHRALIQARIKNEISQKELSVLSGIDQGNLSKLENGLGNPSLKVLRRIADALNMDLVVQFVPKSK